MTHVTLSLISHTNVGKTTLARTLLRRDVGEVRDEAHVTEVSESHVLLALPDATLRLWDTPGFGDTRRLMRRLRHERDPLGWFLHQIWDRVVDRPLWCGQEAARNVRDEADVVLYLVNAAEEPAAAGYVPLELELLTWLGHPVLLLLNQVGEGDAELETAWTSFAKPWEIVRGVLSLDAFTRAWVEEGVLLRQVMKLLDGRKRDAMRDLADAWNDRNLATFRETCGAMGDYLARAALDCETADERADEGEAERGAFDWLAGALKFTTIDKKRAMAALNRRLDRSTGELMAALIEAHGLEGESATKIEQRVQDFQIKGAPRMDKRSGAVAGAVITGALGGLAADALSGGLTLGGGLIAGGILGALGGSALARGYRWIGGDARPAVRWTPGFLEDLSRQVLLRYLAVAHFGRGRGPFRDLEQPEHWGDAVRDALTSRRPRLERIWEAAAGSAPAVRPRLAEELAGILGEAARDVLRRQYPHAADVLG